VTRERLPNRRAQQTFAFEHQNVRFTLSIGLYDDGRPAEAFMECDKQTSDFEAIGRDAAVLISIALQHGASVEVLRGAITRGENDAPASLIGRVLDEMCKGFAP
jgi:ribonucleoside-diphosphate reductase alpha chain